ncbi:MAG TPA: hypothetical protein VIM84_15550, partial [Gemmatimonadales bacterium]
IWQLGQGLVSPTMKDSGIPMKESGKITIYYELFGVCYEESGAAMRLISGLCVKAGSTAYRRGGAKPYQSSEA